MGSILKHSSIFRRQPASCDRLQQGLYPTNVQTGLKQTGERCFPPILIDTRGANGKDGRGGLTAITEGSMGLLHNRDKCIRHPLRSGEGSVLAQRPSPEGMGLNSQTKTWWNQRRGGKPG